LTGLPGFVSLDVRRATAGLALVALALALAFAPRPATAPPPAASFASASGKLPLTFVPNRGQTDARVRYYAQAPGVSTYFLRDRVSIALSKGDRGQALELQFTGASTRARIEALDRRPGRVNYFTTSERHTQIPTYGRLAYRDLWPGIDLVFKGGPGRLKYEFHVAPGADPADIRLAYAGTDSLAVTKGDSLAVRTPVGSLSDAAPRTYQPGGGMVRSRFELHGPTSYGFAIGSYDRTRWLVIDPTLEYSTFIGGGSTDSSWDITVDQQGSAYVTGFTGSADYPITPGAFDSSLEFEDVFVTKLTPDGSDLVYSTLLGPGIGNGIAVDSQGNAYVAGHAGANFPTTAGAHDRTYNGDIDLFVTKLNPSGSALLYSTYIGGSRNEGIGGGHSLAVDAVGNAYVASGTNSADFPTTPGAFDTSYSGGTDANGNPLIDMVVVKLNATGSSLDYSTYLGGAGQDVDYTPSVAVDPEGQAVVTGESEGGFPTTTGAFDASFNGDADAFVVKLTPDGGALVYATYLGADNFERSDAVAVDSAGGAYLTGVTLSAGFPTTPGTYDPSFNGIGDIFALKLNPGGSALDWGTFVGGPGSEGGHDIALDSNEGVHITGYAGSEGFPTTPGAIQTGLGSTRFSDAVYLKLSRGGTALAYSTYLGGIGFDAGSTVATDAFGGAYVSGNTASPDFPVTPGAYDTSFNGDPTTDDSFFDVFVTKFRFGAGPPATLTLAPTTATNTLDEGGHCVTGTVKDAGDDPAPGIGVTFTVTGATSATGTETTDANGEATFCYQGPELPGTDQITATVEPSGPSDTATKTWIVPPSTDGCRAKGGGRITAQNDDQATFAVDVRARTSTDPRGRVGYTDHGPADPFALKSKTIDALACEGRLATIFGHAGSTQFRIDLNDRGTPGRRDTYRILLGSGYDSGTQTLDGGDLRVRG
jgi:hypothetical protein